MSKCIFQTVVATDLGQLEAVLTVTSRLASVFVRLTPSPGAVTGVRREPTTSTTTMSLDVKVRQCIYDALVWMQNINNLVFRYCFHYLINVTNFVWAITLIYMFMFYFTMCGADCGCVVGGSVNHVCDAHSGQCVCRPRVTGMTCDQ